MPAPVVSLLFACPQCGHRNQPHRRVRESVRLWLIDQLPPCKKCGRPLRKSEYRLPKGTPYVKELSRELDT